MNNMTTNYDTKTTKKLVGSSMVEYTLRGKLHRIDGPAVLHADGTREWWVGGLLHREDGPAIEHADGSTDWYEYGVLINNN